jgi:hypothetical protein
MAQILKIKTDVSVFAFVSNFESMEDIEVIGEFDSANYGIGYDFKVRNANCRLFDEVDVRNDDDLSLHIEIDRHDHLTSSEQAEILNYLKRIITQANFILE